MVACRDGRLGVHAEMVGSNCRCLRVWSTARTENKLFQLPRVCVAEADPSRFGHKETFRVAKLVRVCVRVCG